ncbi:putative signal transduction histidine kinase, phosphotransfer (Hpt) domain-containing protein [Rosa chinensis]|uniref:Histidine-containing phosphotransfer protein n=1 Tax=Rosa chinensis TaxID=74649 RepID=A0A2P6RJT8_ROSCH|nr:histidine-containing phosphotransfer protein 4 [Rosa chinensis]PRQ46698.1 putative signal transduction histidine kinase, phosphotransfer (Hpt) domain-containing protein [Rosa chinensis]
MADSNSLRNQISTLRQFFFDEGMLDKHFVQLEELEEENPHFAEEVMTMFFRDSTKLIATVEHALQTPPYDLPQIDQYLHQLKGSSSSVGAAKVWSEINKLRALLKDGEMERFWTQFFQVKNEHDKLKENLGPYFQMLRQLDP